MDHVPRNHLRPRLRNLGIQEQSVHQYSVRQKSMRWQKGGHYGHRGDDQPEFHMKCGALKLNVSVCPHSDGFEIERITHHWKVD